MSNIQTNLVAEFKKRGFSASEFTIADLRSLFEQNGVWIINGQEYDSKHVRTIFANCSIGPGNRIGESVKRGQKPLFIKLFGKARYTLYTEPGLSQVEQLPVLADNDVSDKGKIKNIKKNVSIRKDLSTDLNISSITGPHADYFEKNLLNNNSETWAGGNVFEFANYLYSNGVPLTISDLPNKKFCRKDVFTFVQNANTSTYNCCIAICAWGGMNREHAKDAFSMWDNWKDIAINIRLGNLSRYKAYQAFNELRLSKKIKGLGPAYFTKIIYFLSKPQHRGYIMDQWTARSFNLINKTKYIELKKITSKKQKIDYVVSDKNTAEKYEFFCRFIETLSIKYNTTPDLIEMSLFSQGHRKGLWRNYVVKNDNSLYE